MDEEKPTQVADHDLLGKGEATYEEDLGAAALTPDELETEKHLRRRIDMMIMPLVILVYLMNCASLHFTKRFN